MRVQRWPFSYLGAPGAVIADVQRFMAHYERTFGLLSPDEAKVLPPGAFPAALWRCGALTQQGLAWLGRN